MATVRRAGLVKATGKFHGTAAHWGSLSKSYSGVDAWARRMASAWADYVRQIAGSVEELASVCMPMGSAALVRKQRLRVDLGKTLYLHLTAVYL